MSEHDVDGGERIRYAGGASTEALNGWSGEELVIQGVGGMPQFIEWSPKSKRVHDLEIRARIVDTSAPLNSIPLVRVFVQMGAGKSVFREPKPAIRLSTGTPVLDVSLPARGFVWRCNAKYVRLNFYVALVSGVPSNPTVTIEASIQPTKDSVVPVLPQGDFLNPVAGRRIAFPMSAREWKVYDLNGMPIPAAAISIVPVGFGNVLLGPIDANTLADWRPIPEAALNYQASGAHFVSFR